MSIAFFIVVVSVFFLVFIPIRTGRNKLLTISLVIVLFGAGFLYFKLYNLYKDKMIENQFVACFKNVYELSKKKGEVPYETIQIFSKHSVLTLEEKQLVFRKLSRNEIEVLCFIPSVNDYASVSFLVKEEIITIRRVAKNP